MVSSELANEIVILRGLDREHRRISEEAESSLRDIHEQLKHLSRNMRQAHTQLRKDYESGASEITIAADWARCETLLQKFSRL